MFEKQDVKTEFEKEWVVVKRRKVDLFSWPSTHWTWTRGTWRSGLPSSNNGGHVYSTTAKQYPKRVVANTCDGWALFYLISIQLMHVLKVELDDVSLAGFRIKFRETMCLLSLN
jgi:hypothetical protein